MTTKLMLDVIIENGPLTLVPEMVERFDISPLDTHKLWCDITDVLNVSIRMIPSVELYDLLEACKRERNAAFMAIDEAAL